ncbi:aromatic-ring hydroxylase C-terminal domain-containing protein [Streptomyces sp. NPDC002926]
MTGSRRTSRTQELHAGRGVLLDLEDNAVLRGRASGRSDRVDIVTAAPHALQPGSPRTGTPAVLLVRPDGHMARAAPGSHHDLPMALEHRFDPSRIRPSR